MRELGDAVGFEDNKEGNIKTLLNILLYAAQWLHLRMGGKIRVARDHIILSVPKGRHFTATEKKVEAQLIKEERLL